MKLSVSLEIVEIAQIEEFLESPMSLLKEECYYQIIHIHFKTSDWWIAKTITLIFSKFTYILKFKLCILKNLEITEL